MTTVTVVPAVQSVTACTTYSVAEVGDPATLWGDGSDATYVEIWRDNTSGGATRGVTSPQTGLSFQSATLYARVELLDADNATGTGGVGVDVYDADTLQFYGSWLPTVQPDVLDTTVEITDWTWYENYPGSLADLSAAVATGLRIDVSRGNVGFPPPSPWGVGMRIYEFYLFATTAGGVPQPYRARQRLHPIAPARRWPREAWTGSSSRRVGGYR